MPTSLLPWFRFLLPGLVTASWAAFLLQLYRSPLLAQIQNPHFHLLTLIAALLLLAGTVLYPFLFDLSAASGRWRSALLSFLIWLSPVVIFFSCPLTTFSANRFLQKSAPALPTPPIVTARVLPSTGLAGPPRPWNGVSTDQVVALSVWDLVQAAQDPDSKKELDGRRVEVIGQYVPESSGQFQILRAMMLCCAADAQPIRAAVRGASPSVTKGDWIQVTGTIELVPPEQTLRIVSEKTEAIPAPSDLYLY
jgi:uncharacterized repeat protein (TIGR03943 family)